MNDRIDKLNLNIYEIRTLVLEALKNKSETQYVNLCCEVAKVAVTKGITNDPNKNSYCSSGFIYLNDRDEDYVREIIWNLITENILTIGINSSNPNWPWLKLTEYGKKVVESEMPVPHDPSGYLARIHDQIPKLDNVIYIYLEECLRTYNINALLSSTIALGCASEKALLLLIEAYTNAISDSKRREKFKQKTNGRMIKRQFDEFTKAISNLVGSMPSDISDGLNNVLIGVFEMIRNCRNDAGHPTGKVIEKEILFANIQVFIPYCKKVYELIDYWNENVI
ncbi:hypothetical protein [Maledivibacter halophilus]|uniref:Uncharacterized protein n=1 Tax=Maledivibacter halophilus TaxID=36842 RepID=A0A1T5MR90_9FIRM|nr:hypothetical protein [Maledivibacter halophilus]SKC90429.1 hypothetical protein SAMN02194393_05161 [Maledivibacter halophilus]